MEIPCGVFLPDMSEAYPGCLLFPGQAAVRIGKFRKKKFYFCQKYGTICLRLRYYVKGKSKYGMNRIWNNGRSVPLQGRGVGKIGRGCGDHDFLFGTVIIVI